MKKADNKQLIIYQSPAGALELKADSGKKTIWATLNQIAVLFATDKSGISRHINNILKTRELNDSTVAKFATVQIEGGRAISRLIEYYNLDLILSVGYRVNSKKATVFRQWATKTLREYIIKGYTINRKRVAKNYDSFMKAVKTPIISDVYDFDKDMYKFTKEKWGKGMWAAITTEFLEDNSVDEAISRIKMVESGYIISNQGDTAKNKY